jgi:crotonobetainyl-CoA:carnitine CoA-transferase CaiB-like acyl-CoA transferase
MLFMCPPLDKISIVDFSSLLPGPLATMLLAEAGASVTKVERPDGGDEMRAYTPRLGATSANFAVLNRGKRSLTVDLKSEEGHRAARELVACADVLVEQFRPGVMDRLGLGYAEVAAINPRIVYCSITGYGQRGPRAGIAGHDLNYVAETGLLSLLEEPSLPPALLADIGGGAYPAVVNILLALLNRQRTGHGCHIDISMADGVFTWMYSALASGLGAGSWPRPGDELLTGGSPRYQLYRTADERYLAAAPLEERFWTAFCNVVGLDEPLRDDVHDPRATIAAVRERIAGGTAAEWEQRFAGVDACVSVVRTIDEAVADPHFIGRGLFARLTGDAAGATIPALPVPLDSALRNQLLRADAPMLGAPDHSAEPTREGHDERLRQSRRDKICDRSQGSR